MLIVAKRACCGTVFAALNKSTADPDDLVEIHAYADIGCSVEEQSFATIEPCRCSRTGKKGIAEKQASNQCGLAKT